MIKASRSKVLAALLFAALAIALIFPQPSKSSQASCIMPTSGTVSGLTLVNDINGCNNSLISVWSGASAPAGPQAGQLWYDTNLNYVQQYDGASWISLWYVDSSNHLVSPVFTVGVVTATIASGSTTDLGTIPQSYVTISGTTTVNSFGSSATVGRVMFLNFSGITALTYNATSMILPGAQTITTQVGDTAEVIYLGSGNWRMLRYTLVSTPTKASPTALDYILIQDVAAANAPKKSLISALLSLVGVTSIDTKVGAFTTGNGLDSTGGNVIEMTAARRTLPTVQVLTASSGTYTTPANVLWIEIKMAGGASGGGGGNNGTGSGAGNPTCWAASGAACSAPIYISGAGASSSFSVTGLGGIGGGGYSNLRGQSGSPGSTPGLSHNGVGGTGGSSCFGGGAPGSTSNATATAADANSGAGGGGGGNTNGTLDGGGGSGGAAGGCTIAIINSPAATYTYAIGAGGAGAAGATINSSAGGAGAAGGSGRIEVTEHYGS